MTSFSVAFPNGDTIPFTVATTTGSVPPSNVLHPHTVTFGTSAATQFSVTLAPGAVVKPDPVPPPAAIVPNVPAGVKYGALALNEEFQASSWGQLWTPLWFGGTTMNGTQISEAHAMVGGGVLSLTCLNNVGALVSTNPQGGASPGFSFGYGIVEAMVKLPATPTGLVAGWPAWWTDGQAWPQDGEADIVEGLSGFASSNYHSGGSTGSSVDHPNNSGPVAGTWTGSYATYTLVRKPGLNTVYWNGKLIRSYPTYDGGAAQYLLLTHGPGPNGTGNNTSMLVEYVRAWEAA